MTHEDAMNAPQAETLAALPVDPDAPTLDCETSVLMRRWIRPLVEQASGWTALAEDLSRRGYALRFREGRLWLGRVDTDDVICTMRHLGTTTRDLAERLGRPAVRPMPGKPTWGELRV
ncbi:MAG: hypothetical protein CML68_20980 [Rhodobacteraceae bacterium]|nr:hypothetical protein [Paracoccaceae bacterium]